jgi:hypothetical protein
MILQGINTQLAYTCMLMAKLEFIVLQIKHCI